MKKQYYDIIFKRKSFHLFREAGSGKISAEELSEISQAYLGFESLYPDIKTALRIVPAEQIGFKRDAEYCLLIYSEKKENYLMNAGFIGEQLDLYLVQHDIGSLWFGIGKPDEASFQGLDYVIMIAVRKVNDPTKFRKNIEKTKRKSPEEIWSGDGLDIAGIVRFAPSACNSQPWFVRNENASLSVFRYRQPGKRGIMPAGAVSYYNRIDLGIFLCFLEICLEKKELAFTRELFADDGLDREYTLSAKYTLTPQ